MFSDYNRLADIANRWLRESILRAPLNSGLLESSSYSISSTGKRMRPVLAIAVAELLDVPIDRVRPLAIALEYVHAFSLVHDDLPAIDNSETRRGKATVHRAFSEAQALLTGDSLLAQAFYFLSSDTSADLLADEKVKLMELVAQSVIELCDGQLLDVLPLEKKAVTQNTEENRKLLCEALTERNRRKTGALIRASVLGPTLLTRTVLNANSPAFLALSDFGNAFGLLFQLTDDILDKHEVNGTGSSRRDSYVSILGIDGARKLAKELYSESERALSLFQEKAKFLQRLAEWMLARAG